MPRAQSVPAETLDAVRAHPLVREAMEIFDATSIRVRTRAAAQPDQGLRDAGPDDAEPAALIDAPDVPEAGR